MNEVWRDVVGYEGYYIVSNIGNVKRVGSAVNMKYHKSPNGYLKVCLCVSGTKKNLILHRMVAKAFLANPENKSDVNHINAIKIDNRLENLEWVTSKENHSHARGMGLIDYLSITGEKSGRSKLTERDAANIRMLRFDKKLKLREIVAMYNVHRATIQSVIHFRTWKRAGIESTHD